MNLYYIDLFCGAGGLTTGVVRAGAKVIACINHDPLAIQSHKANHKGVLHFTEDIRNFKLSPLIGLVNRIRREDPNAVFSLWASLECTHFSKAKGGDSRDADSRTLAEHLYRYIQALNPDYVDIENVVEFMSWGPLRIASQESNKKFSVLKVINDPKRIERQGHPYHMVPESRKNGTYYRRWLKHICDSYGYEYDYRILNAADFGARTSRVRYFGQFKKPHVPWTWPEPTHSKNPEKSNGGIGKKLHKWKPVRPALDLEDKGRSIFGRKKDLSENTLKRIYAGLIKHVGDGKEPGFITKWFSGNNKNSGFDEAINTVTTMNHYGVVNTEFITKYMSNPRGKVSNPVDVNSPSPTITTQNRLATVFISKYFSGDHHNKTVDQPSDAITTKDHHSLVFLSSYHGNGHNIKPVDNPSGAILAADTLALVWLDNHNYASTGSKLEMPAPTLLASRRHYYLVDLQFNNTGRAIDKPCFTLIAKMDKKPPYLVETDHVDQGDLIPCIMIYPEDSEILIKIKLFMASHGISDIKMRMLKIPELLRIQGFGAKYILKGTQTDQKRFIGNAVEVTLAKCMTAARVLKLQSIQQKIKAA